MSKAVLVEKGKLWERDGWREYTREWTMEDLTEALQKVGDEIHRLSETYNSLLTILEQMRTFSKEDNHG